MTKTAEPAHSFQPGDRVIHTTGQHGSVERCPNDQWIVMRSDCGNPFTVLSSEIKHEPRDAKNGR